MTRLRLQRWCGVMLCCLFVAGCLFRAVAQESSIPGSSNIIVPPFVRFSGVLTDLKGNPLTGVVGVTFSLYTDSQGSVPVWTEVQNVHPDNTGHYSVMLGSEKSSGLPTDIFVSGQGHWLGVQPEGQAEQTRVLLLSVPYALKAADAETLGGKPASAYLLNPQPTAGVPVSAQSNSTAAVKSSNTSNSAITPSFSGSGTTNFIPRWTSSTNLGNSVIFQSTAGNLGIGTTTPAATLDIQKSTGVRVTASGNGVAVFGNATVASGTGKGVAGYTSSTGGTGVAGAATATTGNTQGVLGWSYSTSGTGVQGQAKAPSGNTLGVEGTIFSSTGVGVQGDGNGIGVQGLTSNSSGIAGVFNNTGGGKVLSGQVNGNELFSVNGSGVTQVGLQSTTPTGILNAVAPGPGHAGLVAVGYPPLDVTGPYLPSDGIDATGGSATDNAIGGVAATGVVGTGGFGDVLGFGGGTGVIGNGGSGSGGGGTGVAGNGANSSAGGVGVIGTGGDGFFAGAVGVIAMGGEAQPGAPTHDGDGIVATTPNGGTIATAKAYAGDFEGDIRVTGAVFAGTKDFEIDHPLDPANKYLLHASVESSEMMNIYSGNATLNGDGQATVVLPDWFRAMNGDFRYQLTSIGAPGTGLYISEEISGNQFKIAGGNPGGKVSWQVTAVRQDPYARTHPLIVEQGKNARERGYYIHPELYGAPREKGIEWARYPELMRELEKNRERQEQQRTISHLPKPQHTRTSSK
jgi:trimeric autotransporter adhesin